MERTLHEYGPRHLLHLFQERNPLLQARCVKHHQAVQDLGAIQPIVMAELVQKRVRPEQEREYEQTIHQLAGQRDGVTIGEAAAPLFQDATHKRMFSLRGSQAVQLRPLTQRTCFWYATRVEIAKDVWLPAPCAVGEAHQRASGWHPDMASALAPLPRR